MVRRVRGIVLGVQGCRRGYLGGPGHVPASGRRERIYIERKPNYSEEVTYLLELGIAETLLVRIGMASLETAEGRFHTVLEIDPGNIEALNLLAQICAQTRRHSKAREFLVRALENAADDRDLVVELVEALAGIYERAGKYRLAVRTYQLGLGRTESAALHNGIAYCYAKLGHYGKAVSHSRRAVELEPGNAVYMSDLGYTLLEAGNLDEAKTVLERAAELDPANELAKANLAHCLDLLNPPHEHPGGLTEQ